MKTGNVYPSIGNFAVSLSKINFGAVNKGQPLVTGLIGHVQKKSFDLDGRAFFKQVLHQFRAVPST